MVLWIWPTGTGERSESRPARGWRRCGGMSGTPRRMSGVRWEPRSGEAAEPPPWAATA